MLIELAGFSTTLAGPLSSSATSATLEATGASTLNAALGGSGWCYLLIVSPIGQELVKATQGANPTISITRAVDGSTAQSFPTGAFVRFAIGNSAVQDLIDAGPGGIANVTGSGLATVTTPVAGTRNVDVATPAFTSSDGSLVIGGSWPALDFTFSASKDAIDGTVTVVTGSGDFTITNGSTTPNVSLTNILGTVTGTAYGSYGAGGYITGLRVTSTGRVATVDVQALTDGVYANASVTVSSGRITSVVAGSGSSGVTSVVQGTGISITGSGTVPIIGLANSGVTAGSYGGLTIDAFGRITSIAGGFNPISFIASGTPELVITAGAPGSVTITIAVASTLTRGIVRLATTSEATDFTNQSLAMTPAGFKSALNSVGGTANYIAGSPALSSGALTNVVASYTVTGTVRWAMIAAHVHWDPDTTAFDASIFVGGSAVQGSGGTNAGGFRTLVAFVENVSGNVELRTTTPTSPDVATGDIRFIAFDTIP
jgi:hypothetical protein